MTAIRCEIIETGNETAEIKRILLRPATPKPLDWTAGAHVRVSLPSGGDRPYSLMRLPGLAPDLIALGVLHEPDGLGGSIYMNGLTPGDSVTITAPVNHFALGDHTAPSLLIAGGIGITPILSMASALTERNKTFSLHYAGRSQQTLAFVPELRQICGDHLTLHHDDQPSALDIPQILRDAPGGPNCHIYTCGPSGMIGAVKSTATAMGWAQDHLHSELFTAQTGEGDTAFDVEIHTTGQIVHVPIGTTIIQALEDAGLDPLYDCQRGDCGICQCDVIDGIPDHRDVILTDAEKASNTVMQICVSRAKSAKLVLDL